MPTSSKKDLNLNEMSNLSIGEIVDLLSKSYSSYILSHTPLKLFPSVMLWGEPGCGKSEGVREIAKRIEKDTGKEVHVTDVRLLLFNPIDLRGIPVANQEKTLAVWLKPKIFQMDPSDKVINILFLDEISAAPQSVQASAYQITLDRAVGEHTLPENCIVIAAGNRLSDRSVAYKMPKALANRLLHLEVKVSFSSWIEYAIANGVNKKVTGFLSKKPDLLSTFATSEDALSFATPRSWVMLSNVLNTVGDDLDSVYPLICGLIGKGTAVEFRSWCKIYSMLPDTRDIFNGKYSEVPQSTDALFALVSSMVSMAKEYQKDKVSLANSITYAKLLPADFSALLLRDYLSLGDEFKHALTSIPEFTSWFALRGKLLNGVR